VIGLAVLSIAVPAALRIRRVRVLVVAAVSAAAAVFLPAQALSPGWPPAGWLAVGCDVGQGDGFAVLTGTPGEAIVIDTGSDGSVMDRCLDRLAVTTVALLVLTHLHADHIGGLRGVLDRGGVQLVGLGPGRDPPTAWGDVLDAADDTRIPVTGLPAGTILGIGDLVVTVLGPDRGRVPAALAPNDQSVVLMIETHGLRMLFAGDVEEAAQRALLRSGQRLDADVLKLPHHGSAKVLPDFLAAVHASVVMIGVGADNEFGHPTAYALELAQQSGAQVIMRTDLEGDIATTFADGVLGAQWRGPTAVRGRRSRRARPPTPRVGPNGVPRP
jgi:competence protein ComEC